MPPPTKLWYLKRCELFEQLSPEQGEQLERRAALRGFRKGEFVYVPGDPGRSVLVVARGRVKIKTITADGKESILAFVDEGELFGELGLFDGGPREEFAEATMPTDILALDREELLRVLEQRPDIVLRITKLMGLRRRRIEIRLRNLLFRSNRQRVAGLLLELLDSHGERNGRGWAIQIPLSHQELAGLIGATRETVTITLGQLQLDGLIKVQRRNITVVDRDRLTSEAQG
ncbi:Crp/Fnr family transcriptional regulator [soil metagenome]